MTSTCSLPFSRAHQPAGLSSASRPNAHALVEERPALRAYIKKFDNGLTLSFTVCARVSLSHWGNAHGSRVPVCIEHDAATLPFPAITQRRQKSGQYDPCMHECVPLFPFVSSFDHVVPHLSRARRTGGPYSIRAQVRCSHYLTERNKLVHCSSTTLDTINVSLLI